MYLSVLDTIFTGGIAKITRTDINRNLRNFNCSIYQLILRGIYLILYDA